MERELVDEFEAHLNGVTRRYRVSAVPGNPGVGYIQHSPHTMIVEVMEEDAMGGPRWERIESAVKQTVISVSLLRYLQRFKGMNRGLQE